MDMFKLLAFYLFLKCYNVPQFPAQPTEKGASYTSIESLTIKKFISETNYMISENWIPAGEPIIHVYYETFEPGKKQKLVIQLIQAFYKNPNSEGSLKIYRNY